MMGRNLSWWDTQALFVKLNLVEVSIKQRQLSDISPNSEKGPPLSTIKEYRNIATEDPANHSSVPALIVNVTIYDDGEDTSCYIPYVNDRDREKERASVWVRSSNAPPEKKNQQTNRESNAVFGRTNRIACTVWESTRCVRAENVTFHIETFCIQLFICCFGSSAIQYGFERDSRRFVLPKFPSHTRGQS